MGHPKLRDERLAWLSVRDELERRSQRGITVLFAFLIGSRGRSSARMAADLHAERLSAKMMRYSVAVDRLSRSLSPEERVTLRETGAVPSWFIPKVLEEAESVRLR
jgi:hypothetical protein